MNAPRIGGLCFGYGGLDLAVSEVLGGDLAWYAEFDKGASKIGAHRWPGVPNHGDMTKIDWAGVEHVDILTGGTPCQDLSHAGARKGMTEGTRSNLWVSMREAIAILRPSLVVWENVGGAFSATATSEVEPCAGCLGDGGDEHALRALHRVLGDLASLGFDAEWVALRAVDVGAPHGRLRVFVAAHPEGNPWRLEHGDGAATGHAANLRRIGREAQLAGALDEPAGDRAGSVRGVGDAAEDAPVRRPAGRATDAVPALRSGDGNEAAVADRAQQLLPTPRTSDTNGAGAHGEGGVDLRTAISLLPTPAVNDMGEGKTVEAWDEWTAKMQAAHGNGNGHGKSLAIEAQRQSTDWGIYADAIARWETLTRPAPEPTQLSKKGTPQLSARFSEWLMGLPAGWVTDVPGITRNEALKALGNGVVPQQAAAALRSMLARVESEAAA